MYFNLLFTYTYFLGILIKFSKLKTFKNITRYIVCTLIMCSTIVTYKGIFLLNQTIKKKNSSPLHTLPPNMYDLLLFPAIKQVLVNHCAFL